MFDLFSETNINDSPVIPMINTGTLLDYMTGAHVPGLNGTTILDGGIAPTNGVHSPPQTFKSTISDGFLINAMERWPESRFFNYDTENAKRDKHRLTAMSSLYRDDPVKRAEHRENIADRIRVKNLTDYPYLDDFLEDVQKIYEKKMKTLKSWEVETPLLDVKTGKPKRMILPTFITVDSLSKAKLKAIESVLDSKGDTSSEANMTAAREALFKNRILRRIPRMAEEAGIYFMFTGQNATKMETGNSMPSKEIQFMRAGEKVKGVGSDYLYLVQSDFEVRSPRVCQDGNKECDYPYPGGITAPAEMSEVQFQVVRCKNHGAGLRFLPVVSQSHGYESTLTDYNYLRKQAKYFGLGKDMARPRPILKPDSFFMRTTAYEKLLDYPTARAVEILSQWYMVLTSWTITNTEVQFKMTPEELMDKLSKSGYMQDDILNSRGWWTYAKNDRPYMSLFDILALAAGQYKPKFWSIPKSKV